LPRNKNENRWLPGGRLKAALTRKIIPAVIAVSIATFITFSYVDNQTEIHILKEQQAHLRVKQQQAEIKLEKIEFRENKTVTLEPQGGYRVTLYYATDRRPLKKKGDIQEYGNQSAESLSYGKCTVHIPDDHVKGVQEKPPWYALFPDPDKYLELTSVSLDMGADRFYSVLSTDVNSSGNQEILVFIHGFNVSFKDAAQTTAQLAYDLEFKGVPVMYSWPSQGKIADYMSDEERAQDTEFDLEDFLTRLARDTHARKIHIIAHSMGNRALTRVLANFAREDRHARPTNPRFRQIILAAPDVGQRLFERLAREFPGTAAHVTLYANNKDKALWLSEKLHKSARGGADAVPYKDIDVIDASLIRGDFLNHSNFATNRILLADIAAVIIKEELPASRRFGIKKTPVGTFFISP
jgi:esterase/lipase superfamily enzyme